MSEPEFNFFQDHSRNYLEMALKTDKQESMESPDGYGKRTGVCGDTVEIYLKVRRERVEAVSYLVDGCINTNACCNTVARLAEGQSVNAAWGITPERVMEFLETLPKDHEHCAELTVGALYLALARYQELNRDPWKKVYQKQG
ncbi:MAG: iron-sulfur cluster assembly scaffold protein [Thermodesulfobacteriota bacterium]